MIREKHLDLDLLSIDFSKMKGWDKPDPIDGSDRLRDQSVGEVAADQTEGESLKRNIENVYLNPLSQILIFFPWFPSLMYPLVKIRPM